MNGQLREKVIANCMRNNTWARQYQEKNPIVKTWQKLGPEHVIQLLENAEASARPDANALLRQMARAPWVIGATVHAGGIGNATRAADSVPHVTLSIAGRGYHLRCRERQGLRVFEITA